MLSHNLTAPFLLLPIEPIAFTLLTCNITTDTSLPNLHTRPETYECQQMANLRYCASLQPMDFLHMYGQISVPSY